MAELLDMSYFGDCLTLGGLGFVCGVVVPVGVRLLGYVVDGSMKFLR